MSAECLFPVALKAPEEMAGRGKGMQVKKT